MKLTKSLLLMTMLAGVAFAQAPSTPNAVAAQLNKATAQAKPSVAPAKPTMPATKPEHAATKPEHVATKPEHAATKHATPKAAAKTHVAKKTEMPQKAAKPAEQLAANAPASDSTAEVVAPELKRGRDP